MNDSIMHAIGRRKEAKALVRLFSGKSLNIVNGKPIGEYFKSIVDKKNYMEPFEVAGIANKYYATIKVEGGGTASQLDAVVHGLSRVLAKVEDKKYKFDLKKAGLLTRDARVKERRKYGHAQKARAMKQSPKR